MYQCNGNHKSRQTNSKGEERQSNVRKYKVIGQEIHKLKELANAELGFVGKVLVRVVLLHRRNLIYHLDAQRRVSLMTTWISPQKRIDTMPVRPKAMKRNEKDVQMRSETKPSHSRNELYENSTNIDVSMTGYFYTSPPAMITSMKCTRAIYSRLWM